MRCRRIVQNQATGKNDIVWFGSHGKNEGYQPVDFSGYSSSNPPSADGLPWAIIYDRYWFSVISPFPNQSPIWGEPDLLPSDALFPGESLFPASAENGFSYFRKAGDSYYEVTSKPSDWDSNYASYYIGKFQHNTSLAFDPAKSYYLHGNSLKETNYSENARGVRDGLVQRLSVIKGELWYKASYGLPLMEKTKNKGIFDSIVIDIITTHPDVERLVSYSSKMSGHSYEFEFVALSVYGDDVKVTYAI